MSIPVYRIGGNRKLYAFEDDIGMVPICGTTLSDHQQQIIRGRGFELVDIETEEEIKASQYFCFSSDLFFTETLVDKVIKVSENGTDSRRFILAENGYIDEVSTR